MLCAEMCGGIVSNGGPLSLTLLTEVKLLKALLMTRLSMMTRTKFATLLLGLSCLSSVFAQSGDIRVTVNPGGAQIDRIFIIPGESEGCSGGQLTSESVVTIAEMQLGQVYTILERQYLDRVLEEQRLGMSGLVFQNSAVDAGRLQGSQGVVFCSVGCIQSREVINLKLVDCQEGVQQWNASGVNADIFKLLSTILDELDNAPAQLELKAQEEERERQLQEEAKALAAQEAESAQDADDKAFDCYDVNHAGHTYELVRIGEDCWFAENLRSDQYANGALIVRVTGVKEWKSWSKSNDSFTGAHCLHEQSGKSDMYGYLYNLHAVHSPYGLCPTGWEVPSADDWGALNWHLGGERVAGGKLKAASMNGNNSSGFTALPAGMKSSSGEMEELDFAGHWWASDAVVKKKGNAIRMSKDELKSKPLSIDSSAGLSIRCKRLVSK